MKASELVKEWTARRRTSEDLAAFAQRENCSPKELRDCLWMCGVRELPRLPPRITEAGRKRDKIIQANKKELFRAWLDYCSDRELQSLMGAEAKAGWVIRFRRLYGLPTNLKNRCGPSREVSEERLVWDKEHPELLREVGA